MKEIKQLTPYFRDLDLEEQEQIKVMRKLRAMQKWLEENIPYNIIGKYSFDSTLGTTCPRCFVYLNKHEDSTVTLMKWLPELKKKGFEIEKFWRKESGQFSYKISKKVGKKGIPTDYLFLFEEGANIDGCKIVKKRRMVTVFETDCEMERVL